MGDGMGWDGIGMGLGWDGDVDVIGCDVSLANKNNDGTARKCSTCMYGTVVTAA
jgi:hypothetical protein